MQLISVLQRQVLLMFSGVANLDLKKPRTRMGSEKWIFGSTQVIEETNIYIYQLGWAPSKICQIGLGGEIIWFGQLQMFCYSRQEDRSEQAKMNLLLSVTQTFSLF